MNSHSAQVGELIDELHEVNEQLAEAARPLQWLSDLDFDRRREIAAKMRAGLARWESVNQRIYGVLWRESEHSGNGSHHNRVAQSAAKEQIR